MSMRFYVYILFNAFTGAQWERRQPHSKGKTLETINHAAPEAIGHDAAEFVDALSEREESRNEQLQDLIIRTDVSANSFHPCLGALNEGGNKWRQALERSHEALYRALAPAYEYYVTMNIHGADKRFSGFMRDALDTHIAKHYPSFAKAHHMNKLVACVIGDDPKRVSANGVALREALNAGADIGADTTHVPPEDLAAWISSRGGIEKIRQGKGTKGEPSQRERAEAAECYLRDKSLNTISLAPEDAAFDASEANSDVVLLGTFLATGEIRVKAVVKSPSAVTAARAAYHKENKTHF